MINWTKSSSSNDDIVISSRIRLARNVKGIPFPNKLDKDAARKLSKKITDSFLKDNNENFNSINLWENDKLNNRVCFEKHLISKKLINNREISSFIYNGDETVSLMINEEDHLRIQTITAGLNIKEAYSEADKIDDMMEERLDYAFHESLGYLTACPTNIGTGLRASVMIHLPAITQSNKIKEVSNILNRVGMVIRGSYGEGTEVLSNLYQISNQVTLGLSEEDLIKNLEGIVNEVINQEQKARDNIYKNYRYELEDKIMRSLSILKSSVLISNKEALELLSNVRMGVEMGIINIEKEKLNSLLYKISSPVISSEEGKELSEKDKNIIRSRILKETLR
ncbi:MAG: protein arginine kinase [Bacillota bacterium]|nr:protein arginine kinase [Bacillota bacterium]